ncbi:hypothetical protein AAFF_G00007270 [Aldrovandia affinis]|uniref:Uncharacterized protein n=1 Tax=Aldrovandia affinis TaxID=143900 RepID=A0AAD7T5Y5_9TELE|nr:hypothetical protein AAFF_G00007270 [Aldrovandia affinis]
MSQSRAFKICPDCARATPEPGPRSWRPATRGANKARLHLRNARRRHPKRRFGPSPGLAAARPKESRFLPPSGGVGTKRGLVAGTCPPLQNWQPENRGEL